MRESRLLPVLNSLVQLKALATIPSEVLQKREVKLKTPAGRSAAGVVLVDRTLSMELKRPVTSTGAATALNWKAPISHSALPLPSTGRAKPRWSVAEQAPTTASIAGLPAISA